MFGAKATLGEFVDLFLRLIDAFRAQQATRFEQDLFRQRKRLADAERTLATKTTKSASESKRIASEKVEWLRAKLGSLRSTELTEDDLRIFPGHYAPVMVWEGGQRVVKPMRYQCRPPGKPPHWDAKYPGTYNARRDNLEGESRRHWLVSWRSATANFAARRDLLFRRGGHRLGDQRDALHPRRKAGAWLLCSGFSEASSQSHQRAPARGGFRAQVELAAYGSPEDVIARLAEGLSALGKR
jgi:hypothetical protein